MKTMHTANRHHQWLLLLHLLSNLITFILADCTFQSYSPAFPIPQLDPKSKIIQQAQHDIESVLKSAIQDSSFDTTTFSIAVTSTTETLFEFHHTARERDENRPGAETTNGETCYRIASCTKAFTVLALLQQQKAGKLNLDDPVNKYIAELNEPQNGTIPWKDITLRTLASQLSGMPRDMGQSDNILIVPNPTAHGLPPLSPSDHHEVVCDSLTNYTRPCTRQDLLSRLQNSLPIYPPKQQSTYCNLAYELLSLVISNVTSTPYETYISESISHALNLTSTTFTRPSDTTAALPKNNHFYWDVQMGIQNPTGGLYSNSNDLSKFLRYVLTHYNGLTPALNWINPISYATGLNTFYGLPWEIFRTDKILPHSHRPVTFVTKSGGLPGYSSILAMLPEHGLGFTILVAGGPKFLGLALENIGTRMVEAADEFARDGLAARYPGSFSSRDINSSIAFAYSLEKGLFVESWVSNGTDILHELNTAKLVFPYVTGAGNQYIQLVPTLLFINETAQTGEIWRMIARSDPALAPSHHVNINSYAGSGEIGIFREIHAGFTGVFRDFCVTDIDVGSYAGLPTNEVMFWDERGDGTFGGVELTGFRIRMGREEGDGRDGEERVRESLVLQGDL